MSGSEPPKESGFVEEAGNQQLPKIPDSSTATSVDGYWGDDDAGAHPVRRKSAAAEFQELQKELSRRSASEVANQAAHKSSWFGKSKTNDLETPATHNDDGDSAATAQGGAQEEFQLDQFMRQGHLGKRHAHTGEATKKVGVVFKNLTVKGAGGTSTTIKTLPEAIIGTFGPDLYRIITSFIPAAKIGNSQPPVRNLLTDFTGIVRPGEMMLVLGRPGSGCSTFLKTIANNRGGYYAIEGDVTYGGISATEMGKKFRGEVIYNPEMDRHLPSLTVAQTLEFSLLNKTKKHDRGNINLIIDAFLEMFAMSHTRNTVVGDEFTRGVSGGERKRVGIAETLATKSTVTCWDNSTRGLDASTAINYAKSLRIMTDVSDRTTLTTLYQAGEGIYELMDKVLVIDQGLMLYQGPAKNARQYFIDLGFHAPPRQTTADFLTSLCDLNARQIREGFEDRCPKTAEEIAAAFRSSDAYKDVLKDVADYELHVETTANADAKQFQESVRGEKSRTVADQSNYTVSFWRQVLACTRREFWLIWGDKTSLYTKFFIIVSISLIVGSLFYNMPNDTSGAFLRGGVAFFSILFLGWLQLAELAKAVAGRDVINRHREYAFYRPSAVGLGRVLADFPVLLVEVIIFGIITYFMTGLDLYADKFFIYLLLIYVMTICLTGMYRMFASVSSNMDDAIRFAGLAFNLLIMYTGYTLSKPTLINSKIWFGWLYYVSPVGYAFEAVLSNEMYNRVMQCNPAQLVPSQIPGGRPIRPENQGCAIPGAALGVHSVTGQDYLEAAFDYSRNNLWRNFGVVIAFSVLYILITAIATELLSFAGSGPGMLVFKKSKAGKDASKALPPADEESAQQPATKTTTLQRTTTTPDEILQDFPRSEKIFTWEELSYTVPTPDGPKKLLNNITGYAKPGVLVALMGASGAGKTTLLNTLSQRQTVGVVQGTMLVDGKALQPDFQRRTGFVEQMDLHEQSATVREALEFSALLRQSKDVSREEKMEHVNKIIDLLEMYKIEDAIIASLDVEQRKRLTIGVELAAKPSLLLFLDEPTSGLDSQAAFSIVRFLRKLCAAGQAIICTIHQPSSELIEQFDKILALNPGGNVFYFGPVGENGKAVVDYFGSQGTKCPEGKNVAEFLIEQGARRESREFWNEAWLKSTENKNLIQEVQDIKRDRADITNDDEALVEQFAAPLIAQISLLTKRMFVTQWRQPSYIYGKLFTAILIGIFNGFTFYKLGNTIEDMQSRMFTCFLILLIPPTVLNAVLPKFFMDRSLWEAREYPSRIYGWVAFCTASIIAEIPGSLVAGAIYWLLWYWPTGLPGDSSTSGYVFLMTSLFFLFQSSWGQWICAFAPSFTVIGNVLPFFLVMFSLFNGVVVPHEQLNVFWRYWLYYANPSTYWIGGVLASTLANQPVECADHEAAHFKLPSGETCYSFAQDFVDYVGRGMLMNPNGTDVCAYCPYKDGSEYLATLSIEPSQKWRNFGIFLVFCFSNWALVYFFIYTVRVKKITFGLGWLFSFL